MKALLAPTLLTATIVATQWASLGKEGLKPPIAWGHFEINESLMIKKGQYARKRTRTLKPKFITIHSTANFAKGADAQRHALAQKNGALRSTHNSLGYLSWHYTVDQSSVYQSLPENEQGQHADYEGQGNRESLGIEMCVNEGNNALQTIERTAKLSALLMKRYGIPLKNVVPHQHWRRIRFDDGKDLGFKNCPRSLLDDGKVAEKWNRFKASIRVYRAQL